MVKKNIEGLIAQGCRCLTPLSDSAKLDTQILLSFVLNKSITYLLTWPEKELSDLNIKHFEQLLTRRLKSEPIAYIVGEKEFWSLPLKVSPATLIPRPDTEIIVEQVLNSFAESKNEIRCLDLGTGTGAIALALASEKPHWLIEAVDLNPEAVALAQQNATLLKLNQVTIYQSDWFSQVDQDKAFDVIVSNPPYIDAQDPHLCEGDVRFEPKSALVADQQGLSDIQFIAQQAKKYLAKGGFLLIEHGYQQAPAVQKILLNEQYLEMKTVRDLSGNDRVTLARAKK